MANRKDLSDISVIIPNWNGRAFLGPCLDSLRKQTFKDFEIIVVDNGSTDRSVEFLKENYPEVKIIALPANKGFSASVNEGIRQSKSHYIALLNNDTEVGAKWLEELEKTLDKNPMVGFCASKVLFLRQRDVINAAGQEYHPDGTTTDIGYGEKDVGQYNTLREVFGASAVAAIYQKSMLEDIGLFDEDFFAYFEDTDISFRAQLKGYKCLYVSQAIVYHLGSATAGFDTPLNVYYCSKNQINVLVKNMPASLLAKYAFPIFLDQVKSVIGMARRRRFSLFWALLRGEIAALLQLPVMVKKRRIIQKDQRVSTEYIDSLFTKRGKK